MPIIKAAVVNTGINCHHCGLLLKPGTDAYYHYEEGDWGVRPWFCPINCYLVAIAGLGESFPDDPCQELFYKYNISEEGTSEQIEFFLGFFSWVLQDNEIFGKAIQQNFLKYIKLASEEKKT